MERNSNWGLRFLTAFLLACIVFLISIVPHVSAAASAAEDVSAEDTESGDDSAEDTEPVDADAVSNPVYDEESGIVTWSYVYFGSYPQTEVTGDDLTDDIINADYDSNGDAIVNGVKYRRLYKTQAVYSTDAHAESFYDWGGG